MRQILPVANRFLDELFEEPEETMKLYSDALENVWAFVSVFNALGNPRDYNYSPSKNITEEDRTKTLRILQEEVNELNTAMENQDRPELLDAVCDIIFVAAGVAMKMGVLPELPKAFSLVCYNNLTKLKKNEDGEYYADIKDGKIQKPEGFEKLDFGQYYKEVNND